MAVTVATVAFVAASPVRVTHLFRYPVKSARAEALFNASVGAEGLLGDRRLMVVALDGATPKAVTQRECPALATLVALVKGDGQIELRSDHEHSRQEKLIIRLSPALTTRRVRLFRDLLDVGDVGDDAAEWITAFILMGHGVAPPRQQKPIFRLVRAAEPTSGRSSGLADAAPVLVISTESLDDLNDRRAQAGLPAVGMSRFRPNVVIEGAGAPYSEDALKFPVRIGGVTFAAGVPCPRCTVPDVDQVGGTPSAPGEGPMASLRRYRRRFNGETHFGTYLWPLSSARAHDANDDGKGLPVMSVGDTVEEAAAVEPRGP